MTGRRPMAFVRRYVLHPLEAAVAFAAYGIFTVLPLNTASALGGWLASTASLTRGQLPPRLVPTQAPAGPGSQQAPDKELKHFSSRQKSFH